MRWSAVAVSVLLAALTPGAPLPGGVLETILEDGFESGATCAWSSFVSPTIPGGCLIAGACYPPGATDPENQGCRTCDPSASETSWTNVNEGGNCSDGDACTTGDTCSAGACQSSGTDPCTDPFACTDDSCVPPTGCVHEPQDTVCDDLLACTINTCVEASGCQTTVVAGSCIVDGACYADGELSPVNPCLACDSSTSATSFTQLPASTPCSEGVCTSETGVEPADLCNAAGVCVDSGSASCTPYDCSGGACLASCVNSSQCAGSSYYCSAGSCLLKKLNGQSCTATEQCQSNQCVDGVCCASACSGTCESCTIGTGACDAVANGTDPAGECSTQDPSTCGRDGFCSGTRSCRLYVNGTQCVAPVCVGGAFPPAVNPADLCNGTGTCVVTPEVDCGAYLCASGACRTSCTQDFHCDAGFICSAPNCVPF